MVFDGVDTNDVAFRVGVHAVTETIFLGFRRFVPGGVELLHE